MATHFFFSDQDAIETRSGTASSSAESLDPEYQYIFSARGQKIPLLRDTYLDDELSSADRIYYLTDANTNVTAVVAQQSGGSWAVTERYVYDAYGSATIYNADWSTTRSFSAVNNRLLYASMVFDPVTGVYYDQARWYSVATSEFVTRDPIGFLAGDLNLYRYCGNNPTVYVDPSGLVGIFFDGAGQAIGANTVIQRLAARYTGGTAYIYATHIWPNNIQANIDLAHKRVCQHVCPKNSSTCPPKQVGILDIFGWSRGGIAALTLAKLLKDVGCKCKCGTIKPVIIHYLGLIDPVATGGMQMWGTNSTVVPDNVQTVAIAWAGQKSFWGSIVFNASQLTLEDATKTTRKDATFAAIHEVIGFLPAVENWLVAQTFLRVFK
jgi:RHS repeat-associated protein